jgi:hypothetical protein
MPDSTLSQALKEAYASAPANEIIMHTLEIWHEAFTTPIRVVRDDASFWGVLESTAPRNAGQYVEFIAFAFDILPPDVAHEALPNCIIEFDNIDKAIIAQIDAAMVTQTPITLIYRAYLSSDPTGPENDPPLTLTVKAISADVYRIRVTAGFDDLANKRFPKLEYTSEVFPGLIAS